MATSETEFQTELVKAFARHNMHAFKASHRDKVGVLDIYVRGPKAALWIECKWLTVEKTFRSQKVSLTHHQNKFAKKELECGGHAVKIIGYRRKTTGFDVHGLLICNARNRDTQVPIAWLEDRTHHSHIIKPRGSTWSGGLIMDRCLMMENQVTPYADEIRDA